MTAPNAGAGRWPMSTDPLTEVLHAVAWPDGSTDGLPTYSVCRMLADAVLASDWLAAHDAQVRADERERIADDYRERLTTADDRLGQLIESGEGYGEDRLRGKREGVRLALSYLDEAARIARDGGR